MNSKYKDPYDYEKKTASKIIGARRSIASGALFGDMDVHGEYVMIDCKRVADGHSYRLDYRDFDKVVKRVNADQMPVMTVNYNKYGESLAVLKEEDFIQLLNTVIELVQDN